MCVVCLTLVSVATVAISLTTASCQKKPDDSKADVGSMEQLNLPSWVLSPYDGLSDNVVAGVGISKKPANNDQLRFLIIQAEAAARAEIATTIQTEVSRMVKDAMQSASIEKINAVESSFAVVTQEVVKNVPLSGAVRDKIYQDKNGIVYVRLIINNNIIKNYLNERLENYNEVMRDAKLSRATIKKTNESLKHLFEDLNFQIEKKVED